MFYFDVDLWGGDRMFHSCHRGERQICPGFKEVERHYYEDGYFRGLPRGSQSGMFEGSPFPYNILRCKACGEDYTWVAEV